MIAQQEWLKLAQDDDGSFYLRLIGSYPSLQLAKSNHPGAIVIKDNLGADLDALLHLLITGQPGLVCKHEPRTFHRRITIHEALSEEPFNGIGLDDILTECRDGHMSGCVLRGIHSTHSDDPIAVGNNLQKEKQMSEPKPAKRLYVSCLGEVENEGVDMPYDIGDDLAAPLSKFDLRFVQWTRKAQDMLNDGRFNVRGIWPHILLDTEFVYPLAEAAKVEASLAKIAKKLKLKLEPMDTPEEGDKQVSLTHLFPVSRWYCNETYRLLVEQMERKKKIIATGTKKLWDRYGMSVS